MGIRVRSRCGKRPVPLRADRREGGKAAPAVKTVLSADGSLDRTYSVNGVTVGKVHLADIPPESKHFGTEKREYGQQGETVGPRSAMTVYVERNHRAQREFVRRWTRGGLRLRRLVRDGAPVSDPRGDAYAVDGDADTLQRMTLDTRCRAFSVAVLARHALNSGQYARKPKAPAGTVRRHCGFRTVNGQPVFGRF